MNPTTTRRTASPTRPLWTVCICLLTGLFTLQPASAVTLNPSADTRADYTGTPTAISAANTADLAVGPLTATPPATNRWMRTYMTFDLSGLTANDIASTATLSLFNTGGEANTSALPQVYTLFQVASSWNGVNTPGPEGTALATVNITPAVGTDTQNIEFSGTNLANAFNSAIGGNLYLGIKTDQEGAAARSLTFLQSAEDPSPPALSTISANLPTVTVSVPDDSLSEPGPATATFTFDRGSATNSPLTVYYTFTGTATQGSDYTDSGSGSVTFAAGASNANVVVSVVNDAEAERLETVILTLTADAAYNIGSPSKGTATIIDDNDDNNDVLVRYIFTDANSTGSTFSLAPQVYSTNVSATALAAPGISIGTSSLALSPPTAGYIASTVTTSNQTEAIASDDYFSFTLTPTIGNSLTLTNLELSARYYIVNSFASEASIFVRSSLDGFTSDVGSNSFSAFEPDPFYTTMSIPLGASFTQIPGNITFRVYVFDDTDTGTDGLRIDDIFVRGTIGSLPPPVNIVATGPVAVERSTPGEFIVNRFGVTATPLTVHYSVSGTASNGVDYVTLPGQVTIGAGQTGATIAVTPIDDLWSETVETVTLTLQGDPAYSVVPPTSATVSLADQHSITAFDDEFDGVALDASVWARDSYRTNVSVTNGVLELTARQEGSSWREGSIQTVNYAGKYGYYEARLKVNDASGLNNAFWLNTPADLVSGNAVDRTEIDITEAHYHDNLSHMTFHDWAPTHWGSGSSATIPNISASYHTVALEWQNDNTLVWYWDGVAKRTLDAATFLSADTMIPLSVLLSTKVIDFAGSPGPGLDGSKMLVDYVRVLQKPGWIGAVNGNWGSSPNWGPAGVPGNSEAAIFNLAAPSTVISLAGEKLCNSLYFDNATCPAFTFAAGPYPLHLGAAGLGIGGVTINTPVTNSQTINLNLVADRALQFGNFSRTPSVALTLNGGLDAVTTGTDIQLCGFAPIRVAGSLSTNIGDLVKWGSGTATLSGTNAHRGLTQVLGGTLVVASPFALGETGTGRDTLVTNGATLVFASGVDYGVPEVLHLSGTGSAGRSGVIDVESNGAASFGGPVILEADVAIGCAALRTLDLGGSLTGAGGITKSGAGSLRLAGSNSFAGSVDVFAGTLVIANGSALGTATAGTRIENTGQLQLEGGITNDEPLELEGAPSGYLHLVGGDGTNLLTGNIALMGGGNDYGISSWVGRLTLAGDIVFADTYSGTRALRLDGAGDGIITGAIRDGASAVVAINKAGAGRWTLSGTNTYSAATTVAEGALLLDGTSLSAVTVSGGTLGGSGIIAGVVTVNSGGTLSPGASPGTLTLNSNLVLDAGSTNVFEVDGSSLAQDQVLLGGNATYAGVLKIVPSGTFTNGQTFTLFSGAGATSASNFSSIQGSPGSGKAFSFTNGVLGVVSTMTAPSPTPLTNSYSGGVLTLSWPGGLGWRLQEQTNALSKGISTNWVDITPGSASLTNLTVSSTRPTVFYRLVYP